MLLDADNGHTIDVLEFLSNPLNLEILRLLSKRCSYPRELARLLGKSESLISRHLRRAEELGLVSSKWATITIGSRRITAKTYCLNMGRLILDLSSGRLQAEPPAPRGGSKRQSRLWEPLGRRVELSRLRAAVDTARLVIVYGPPKSGKTHLVKYAVSEYYLGRPAIYINITPGETLESFSRILQIRLAELGYEAPEDFDALAYREEVVRVLSKARAVLVLDDLHNAFRDSRLTKLVGWLAGDVYSRDYTLFLVSRIRPQLGAWRGKTIEIELGPVTPRVFAEIVRRYSSMPIEEEQFEELSRKLPLLPGYAVMYARIVDEVKDPAKAAELLESAVSRGLLSTIVEDDRQWSIISLLAVAGKPVPTEAVCKAAGCQLRECESLIRQLSLAGVVKFRGTEVYLDDYYLRLAKVQIQDEKLLKSRLASALAEGEDYYWKGEAAKLLAEACDVVRLVGLVRDRLASGSSWPFANLQAYTQALEEALEKCPLSSRDKALLEAELALFRGILERPLEAALRLEEVYEKERSSKKPEVRMLVRLASLAALAYTHAGRLDRAEELLGEAERYAGQCKDKDALITFYTNRITFLLTLADKSGDPKLLWEALNTARSMEYLLSEEQKGWNDRWLYLWVLSVVADLERQLGQLDTAQEKLEKLWNSILEEKKSEANPLTYNVAVSLAYLYAEKGMIDEALRVLEEAGERALRLTNSGLRMEFLEWISADMAIMHALKCDYEKARNMFPRGVCEERGESPLWNWRCALYRGLVLGEKVEVPASSPSVARILQAAHCQLAES